MLGGRLLVCEVQEPNRRERGDEEYHIEPAVIKIKLQIAQYLRYNYTVLGGHVHSH